MTKIKTFYTSKQVLKTDSKQNVSKSPLKAKLLLEHINKVGLMDHFDITDDFKPFDNEDFYIAHTKDYVHKFFNGIKPLCESNNLKWSKQFAETVRYTNASLYNAIKFSIENPEKVCFSMTSGFHHANPYNGAGFCTFSGQVIASLKIYKEFGLSGAYLDLDAHYGNSIKDSYEFVPVLYNAIPIGCNINPDYKHKQYIQDFKFRLKLLEQKILNEEIHYLVWCHGADSQEDDDLRTGQLTTDEWIQCSTIFYKWVKKINKKLGVSIPLTLCLFGGYRKDNYISVLNLHVADLIECLNILCNN
jgi:acetoin utilization deacetylase AcuC-like enzyme